MIVDASVWVSSLLPADEKHALSNASLREQGRQGVAFVAPTLTIVEVAGAIGRITGSPALAWRASQLIVRRPWIRFVHLDDVLAQEAARLAADLRLRGADAVYVAVAARLDLPVVTWDMEMIRRAPLSVRVQTP